MERRGHYIEIAWAVEWQGRWHGEDKEMMQTVELLSLPSLKACFSPINHGLDIVRRGKKI